jgi:CheY-like chemotaxis protein
MTFLGVTKQPSSEVILLKTVLLAENLEFSRVVMSQTIRSVEDCTVIEVENGEQALRDNTEIDVIISDIMMPPLSGLELLKMVRAGNTAAVRDISKRKNEELRLRDFGHIAADWFWEMDENLVFTYFSQGYETRTGLPIDQIVGKKRKDVQPPGISEPDWTAHFG